MKKFDQKFGKEFLAQVPTASGIYRVFDGKDQLVYVGKAKNLRRRLSQYRNAKRRKKHMKMRSIVGDAARIEYQVCESHLDACLAEAKLIQELRPKWNVAGAFCFLYPMIGVRFEGGHVSFCYTTSPDQFPGYRYHGAYRSRYITKHAFFALMELLGYIGHRQKGYARQKRYSYVFSFRQIPESWVHTLEAFFRGESESAIADLVLALIEVAGARSKKREIQDYLNDLKRFWKLEAQALAAARSRMQFNGYPVAQKDRDQLFIQYRQLRESQEAAKKSSLKKKRPKSATRKEAEASLG